MCGIIGIVGSENLSKELYRGAISLQHRGQDAAGMFSYDESEDRVIRVRETGLAERLIPTLKKITGEVGLAHLRYPTAGSGDINDAQPLYITSPNLVIAVTQNGNLVNYNSLKAELKLEGEGTGTSSDGELILNLLNEKYSPDRSLEENIINSVGEVYRRAIGSYSILSFNEQLGGIVAFRDPQGIKPLLYGEREIKGKKSFGFASEDEALYALGFRNIHDLVPGTVAMVGRDRQLKFHSLTNQKHAHCMFEYFYFAGPEACLEGINVMEARLRAGRYLAEKIKGSGVKLDYIVPVPDTGRTAAIAIHEQLGVPLGEGLIKNRYVGRSFINPDQDSREQVVGFKFKPVRYILSGSRVILIEDSIVRGTTMRKLVNMVRTAGAIEVYVASTKPIVQFPCYHGIDFQQGKQLIGAGKNAEGIRQELGADGIFFNQNSELSKIVGIEDLCTACCTGKYPTDISEATQLGAQREEAQRES